MVEYLFDDTFDVRDVDPEGKKFDRALKCTVSRLKARSENYEMDLTLDINNELFPMKIRDKFEMVLSSSISLDGSADDGNYDTSQKESLADNYDYVMYGKVYKYDPSGPSKVAVYVSYGGLLMKLEGDPRHMQEISIGSKIYLLMKKL